MSLQEEPECLRLAETFNALSHPRRVVILDCLLEGERTVGSLATCDRLQPCSQANTSQHLAILRRARLVKERRDGNKVHYSLVPGVAKILRSAREFDRKLIQEIIKEAVA